MRHYIDVNEKAIQLSTECGDGGLEGMKQLLHLGHTYFCLLFFTMIITLRAR